MDWYCKRQGITHLTLRDLEGPAFEIVKVFHPYMIHLQFQMEECHKLLTDQVDDTILRYNVSKPLPLGGEPGHVSRPALSISKMKAAYYPDVGLEQLVPDQFWIEEECKYDITAMYGHLNHLSPEDKKILTTAVNLWTRNLVIRKRVEDFQLGIESYQTQLNLTKPRWEATGFEFKHDFTVIDSPRAVIFRDRYGVQMIIRYMFYDPARADRYLPGTTTKHLSDTKVLTMKMEILLEPTSNKLLVGPPDPEDQAKMEMETPRSSGVNSPPNAHT
ncbi:hypothetical protein Tco_0492149 [Tanacetum coccineum]